MKKIKNILMFVLIFTCSLSVYSFQPGPNAAPNPRILINENVEKVISKLYEASSILKEIPLEDEIIEDTITILERKEIQNRIGRNVSNILACGSYYIVAYKSVDFNGNSSFRPGRPGGYNIITSWIKVYKPYYSSEPEKVVFIFHHGKGNPICD